MKTLLLLLLLVSPSLYARGGGHGGGHSGHSSSHSSEGHSSYSSHSRVSDDSHVTNLGWTNNWSIFNTVTHSNSNNQPTVNPTVNEDSDCRKYKQYSSSGNSVNCDFDGNVQQYKEYSTHKR